METTLPIRTRGPQQDAPEPIEPYSDEAETPSEPESPPPGQNNELQPTSSLRRATEPLSSTILYSHRAEAFYTRPRNRSPYSRSHLRSYSAASTLSAPPMARTRSLPNTAAALPYSPSHSPVRPSSPLRSPANKRPSPRRSFEDRREPSTPTFFMDIESIAEDSELDITPRPLATDAAPPLLHHANTIPRSRRSPNLSHTNIPPPSLFNAPQTSPLSTPPTATTSRFNEAYPSQTTYSSSMPSTPTSLRSRSPSISSLETIPDSPDAEEAAIEAFNIAKLNAAAEAADRESGSDSDSEKKLSVGARNDRGRKRWSVCGAERRGDLEMETIWED